MKKKLEWTLSVLLGLLSLCLCLSVCVSLSVFLYVSFSSFLPSFLPNVLTYLLTYLLIFFLSFFLCFFLSLSLSFSSSDGGHEEPQTQLLPGNDGGSGRNDQLSHGRQRRGSWEVMSVQSICLASCRLASWFLQHCSLLFLFKFLFLIVISW